MKRFLSALLLIALVVSFAGCSSQQEDTVEEPSPQLQEASDTALPSETAAPTPTPEPEPYAPVIYSTSSSIRMPVWNCPISLPLSLLRSLKVLKSWKVEIPSSCPYLPKVICLLLLLIKRMRRGFRSKRKNDRFNEYSENGFTEFTGADGRVVTIRQQKPHDEKHENGACLIELTYNVPAAETEKYTRPDTG